MERAQGVPEVTYQNVLIGSRDRIEFYKYGLEMFQVSGLSLGHLLVDIQSPV